MFVADDEFCINLNRLRLVVKADNVPMFGDPDYSLTLVYENTRDQKSLKISYTSESKRDLMHTLILSSLGTNVNLRKTHEKEPEKCGSDVSAKKG